MFFIGGFLGAGKTTAILHLARIFGQKGLKAAAITNDQAEELVDTFFLSNGGVPAEQIAGSCFCCNFNGLAEAVHHSIQSVDPDVILAEPVGSCTDIVATVIRPMRALMSDQVRVPSYFVLVEPDRWLELGDEASTAPWSMKYLFLKQLEEADFIVVTKLDTLTNDAGREIQGAVQRAYTEAKVLGISARLGLGLEHWIELAQTMSTEDRWLKDIDYQRYAEAEAEMGWLNAKVSLTFPEPRDGKVIAARMAEALVEGVSGRDGSIGHLKLLAVGNTGSVKAGLTRFGRPVEFDGAFTGPLTELQVTLNMRATVSPGDLTAIALACLERLKMADRAETDVSFLNTFRPAPPKPTFRYDQDN